MPTRDTEGFFKRQDLIKAKLKSRELTPEDIKTYNENANSQNALCKSIWTMNKPKNYRALVTPFVVFLALLGYLYVKFGGFFLLNVDIRHLYFATFHFFRHSAKFF